MTKLGKGRIPPLKIFAFIVPVIGLTIVSFISIHETFYGLPKDEEALKGVDVSLDLRQQEGGTQLDIQLSGNSLKDVKMTVLFAYLDSEPQDIFAAIRQIRNSKYQRIKTYSVDVPSQMRENYAFGDALGYLSKAYAVAVVDLRYKNESWFRLAGPIFEMKTLTIEA